MNSINLQTDLIMAVDLGTSNLKGALFNLKGEEVAFKAVEYDLYVPEKDIVENDVNKYWSTLVGIIKYLISKIDGNTDRIIAVGTSSQGETIVPVDKKGIPLSNAIVWLDNRADEEAKEIAKNFDAGKMFKLTGNPEVSPSWPAARIKWFEKKKPDIFRNTHKFLIIEDYIIYKLTGRFVGEASVYNSSYYYDIRRFRYIDSILEYLGISEEKLPSIVKPGSYVANISQEASNQTGLSLNTRVIIGAMDQLCGAVGAGNLQNGLVSETTGTAFAMVITIDKPMFDSRTKLPCYLHAVPDLYALLPYSFTGGMVLKWFKDNFCQDEIGRSVKEGIDVYNIMTELASKISPGSDGLIMLPHLAGAYFPEYNSKIRGVYSGIGLNHTKGHFIRAIMESLGYMMRSNIESLVSLGINIDKIISIGGGAKSSLWCQIKSDITGIRVEVPEYSETALLGAVILTACSMGIFTSIEEACRNFIKIKRVYNPQIRNKDLYSEGHEKYQNLYKSIKKLF